MCQCSKTSLMTGPLRKLFAHGLQVTRFCCKDQSCTSFWIANLSSAETSRDIFFWLFRSCPLKASAHPASKHAGSFLAISSHFCADARSAHHDPQCVLVFCRQPFQRFGKLFHAWSNSRRWTVSLQHLGDLLKSGDYWQGQLASHWPSLAAVSNASTWWCTSSIIFI